MPQISAYKIPNNDSIWRALWGLLICTGMLAGVLAVSVLIAMSLPVIMSAIGFTNFMLLSIALLLCGRR